MATDVESTLGRFFSIGHSNHPIERFLVLLAERAIDVLVDVRSHPYSRYASQFDRDVLRAAVSAARLRYVFLGEQLGGRPSTREHYDSDGCVLYSLVAESPRFLEGVRQLESVGQEKRVAIMCSEEDPLNCHRYLLVTRVLASRGIAVAHIRADGRLQDNNELEAAVRTRQKDAGQLTLFVEDEIAWKSTRSVLQRGPRPTSSGR